MEEEARQKSGLKIGTAQVQYHQDGSGSIQVPKVTYNAVREGCTSAWRLLPKGRKLDQLVAALRLKDQTSSLRMFLEEKKVTSSKDTGEALRIFPLLAALGSFLRSRCP